MEIGQLRTCKCGKEYEHYGQRALLCKPCRRIYHREYHHKRSPEKKQAKLDGQYAAQRKKLQAVIDYLKEHSCADCGETRVQCLQFDHINPEQKTGTISNMVRNNVGLPRIFDEIAKCRILCANCHAVHTAQQLGWYKGINI